MLSLLRVAVVLLSLTTLGPLHLFAQQPTKPEVRIFYTGRLFGYYYAEDSDQDGFAKCPDDQNSFSAAAQAFLKSLPASRPDTVLVGTGDNFAPELEARIFWRPPSQAKQKELYSWNYLDGRDRWIDNKIVETFPALYWEMLHGKSWIPADNVACFLQLAHYDAIVPGKHDFHFGPERLRSLARTLATKPDLHGYQAVQMLGTNIVIKTSRVKDPGSVPEAFDPVKLGAMPPPDPRNPPSDFDKLKPSVGNSVYPWIQYVQVKGTWLSSYRAYLWDTSPKDPFVPVMPPCQTSASCSELKVRTPAGASIAGSTENARIWFSVPADRRQSQHFTTLAPGQRYSFCIADNDVSAAVINHSLKSVKISCTWFSVLQPFFLYPGTKPTAGTGTTHCIYSPNKAADDHCYNDPEPFVLKPALGQGSLETVIFGVVDPEMEQHIGEWNALWEDLKIVSPIPPNSSSSTKLDTATKTKLKSTVSFEEPIEAVREMMQYFDRKYCLDNNSSLSDPNSACFGDSADPKFNGTKILLAEMPPEKVQRLVTRINSDPDFNSSPFNVAVTSGDDELTTPDQLRTVAPFKVSKISGAVTNSASLPVFVLIPPQAWHSAKAGDGDPAPASPVRSLRIQSADGASKTYLVGPAASGPNLQIASFLANQQNPAIYPHAQAESLAQKHNTGSLANLLLKSAVNNAKLSACEIMVRENAKNPNSEEEKLLDDYVLCTMQHRTHADISLLQQRDFYWDGLKEKVTNASRLQEDLDAVLWKGDFLTLLAVPGSTLLQMMKESDGFDADDKNNLSFDKETGRGLVALGITKDPVTKDYLVNHTPLDSNRIYAVATTDYIATGDTGYTELADLMAAQSPNLDSGVPTLELISSVVCSAAIGAASPSLDPKKLCNPSLPPGDYFDQITGLSLADPRPGKTFGHNVRQWSVFRTPSKDPFRKDSAEGVIQDRPIWSLTMDKFSVGYGALFHKYSEKDLGNFFGGVQASDVTAARYSNWNLAESLSLTRSTRLADIFISQDLSYIAKFTAATAGPSKPVQSANLMDYDGGVNWHWQGRRVPNLDLVTVFHAETQAFTPIQSLNVSPAVTGGPKLLNFELGRTWTALGRLGFRKHDKKSYAEAGLEAGRDLDAINAFQFQTAQGADIGTPCVPTAKNTLQGCATALPAVNTDSRVQILRGARSRSGIYWHGLFDIPVFPKITESLENQGDFFFNNSGDNSTDTRLRDLMTNKLTFQFLPNLSFSPTYKILFYRNKVDNRFLWQQQAMVTIDFYFNLTNLRIHKTEMEYKPPAQK